MRAHHETHIKADTVWQLHADVNAWPSWQRDITAAHIAGAFQSGASFEWTSYGFTVVPTIYAVAERARTGCPVSLERLRGLSRGEELAPAERDDGTDGRSPR